MEDHAGRVPRLGLAFGAAMIAIYVLLVAQTGSFAVPLIVMMAIPLTILGVMPGFWLLNALNARHVGGYLDPVYFTATGMIGMIALAGIVTATRSSWSISSTSRCLAAARCSTRSWRAAWCVCGRSC